MTLREIQSLKQVWRRPLRQRQASWWARKQPGGHCALQKARLKDKTVRAGSCESGQPGRQLYGSIANPDLGYPIMSPSATGEGQPIADVVIG